MKVKTNIISALLTITMILSFIPNVSFAKSEEGITNNKTNQTNIEDNTHIIKKSVEDEIKALKDIENLKKTLEKESSKPADSKVESNLPEENKEDNPKSELEISNENVQNPVNAVNPEHGVVKYSGTQGGVTWEIFEDGHLLFRPTNGVSGTFDDMDWINYDKEKDIYPYTNPWTKYDNKIDKKVKTISFSPGVIGGKSLKSMFQGSQAIEIDLTNLNTSNVIYMNSMFKNSKALKINLSESDTGNVKSMDSMFEGSNVRRLDLSNFNTKELEDISYMFRDSQVNYINLTSFNTSKVKFMVRTFDNIQVDTLDLKSFDTSNVVSMAGMFFRTKTKDLYLKKFNTSKVTHMMDMFSSTEVENLDLSSFNTINVVNMERMFTNSKIKNLDISSFNTSNVINMEGMFAFTQIDNLDLHSFDTTNVKKMLYIFNKSKFNKIKLSPKFYPKPDTYLNRESSDIYTGKWIREDGKYGPWTSDEFMVNYKGGEMAGTYIMEKVPQKCKISFDANGAQGNMETIETDKGEKITLSDNKFIKKGYKFKGFSINKDGSGTLYQPGDDITSIAKPGEEVKLYAIWEYINETSLPSTGTYGGMTFTAFTVTGLAWTSFVLERNKRNKYKNKAS